MLKIEVSRSYPHQSLDFCVDSIAMLRDLLGAARADELSLSDNSITGICMTLSAVSDAMMEIRNLIQEDVEAARADDPTAPRLTEPRSRRASVA
ncbi:hypothetical protein JCM25156A_20530 [Komagataeibacter kakiaceti JCM 25156]